MKQKLEALISMTIRQTEWLLATGEVAWDHAGSRRRVIPNLSLILLTLACAGLRLLRDAPHEANKLPRDCSADDGRFFFTCTECAVSGCKASLRFPRDLPYAWWRGFNFVELLFADP